MQKPIPTFLTPKELAARWKISKSSVYRLKDIGQLSYVQIAGTIRFRLEDIEAYEAAGYQHAIVWPKVLRERRRLS